MKRHELQAFGALLALTVLSAPAAAIPVTWTFDNVIYSDTSTLDGYFVYDADLNQFTESDFVLICGGICYTAVVILTGATGNAVDFTFEGADLVTQEPVAINFYIGLPGLSNEGGLVTLQCCFSHLVAGNFVTADIVSGSIHGVAAVPIPAAVW